MHVGSLALPTGTLKWNRAVLNVISYTLSFPALTNACWEKGLLGKRPLASSLVGLWPLLHGIPPLFSLISSNPLLSIKIRQINEMPKKYFKEKIQYNGSEGYKKERRIKSGLEHFSGFQARRSTYLLRRNWELLPSNHFVPAPIPNGGLERIPTCIREQTGKSPLHRTRMYYIRDSTSLLQGKAKSDIFTLFAFSERNEPVIFKLTAALQG